MASWPEGGALVPSRDPVGAVAPPPQVLRNDVLSHARTVQSVNEAGQGLLLSSLGDAVDGLQCSLQQLNQRWDLVRSETESRQLELENNLSQVQATGHVLGHRRLRVALHGRGTGVHRSILRAPSCGRSLP